MGHRNDVRASAFTSLALAPVDWPTWLSPRYPADPSWSLHLCATTQPFATNVSTKDVSVPPLGSALHAGREFAGIQLQHLELSLNGYWVPVRTSPTPISPTSSSMPTPRVWVPPLSGAALAALSHGSAMRTNSSSFTIASAVTGTASISAPILRLRSKSGRAVMGELVRVLVTILP